MRFHFAPTLLSLWAASHPAIAHSTRGAHAQKENDSSPNMNGEYVLASTPHGKDTNLLFPTNYKDYPDKPTTHFDVYSPKVSQLYSQVFWKGLPPVKLPQNIIDRFQDNPMAVVGFELDQIMEDEDGNEFSIPFNALYNHHFESTMIGGNTKYEFASPDDERLEGMRTSMGHGIPPNQPYWLVVDEDLDTGAGIPTKQAFGASNGGEVRQSFHGYAPGIAQIIASPHSIQITPMQIDTWNRDEMDLKNSTQFVAGPLPRNSLAPPDASYSGLLECPVSTRIQKHLPPQGYFVLDKGTCSKDGAIAAAKDCYEAVSEMVRETDSVSLIHNVTGSDAQRPVGCSVRVVAVPVDKTEPRVLEAFYNTEDDSQVHCEARSDSATLFSASASSLVQVTTLIDTDHDVVTITLAGPSDVWFGVGFGAKNMGQQPWTIVVEGDNGAITERKLADHDAGVVVTPSIKVQSDTTNGDQRTVVITRPIANKLYSFDTKATEIPFINAIGSSAQFSYHKNKEPSSMLILPVHDRGVGAGAMCLCQQDPPAFGKDTGGTLEYHPVEGQPGEMGTKGKVTCQNWCVKAPRMDLLDQKNPTCDVRTYSGGQLACHHMWSLLDADQDIPWPDQPLEYRLKFRFWVQDYDADYHTMAKRTTWGIASPVEYDVPKCAEGMPGCSQQVDPETGKQRWVHTIRGKFNAGNSGKLVAAHFHCHAPTCLRTALYRCPKDVDLCDETNGELLCEENAVQRHGEEGERFNEPGFIFQPPCLWGSSEVGLEEPVDVKNQTLFAIKTAEATYGHHGEMAWLQMYYV